MDNGIFVNSGIFKSDADYIIGGFHTTEQNGFTYTDFYFEFRTRARKLLNDFIEETSGLYAYQKREEPYLEARLSAARIIYDNLKIMPESSAESDLFLAIVESNNAEIWLDSVYFSLQNFEESPKRPMQIPTENYAGMMNKNSSEYLDIKSLVEDTNFTTFIEQLSMLEP